MNMSALCRYPQLSVVGQGGSNVTQAGCVGEGKGGEGSISDCRPTGRGQSLRSSTILDHLPQRTQFVSTQQSTGVHLVIICPPTC